MREIKYKFWSGKKMFTDLENVMECLKQQVSGRYDHIGLHGAAFPQYTGLKDMDDKEIYENDVLHLSYGCPPTVAHLHVVFKDASFKVLCSNSHPRENLLSEVCLSDCYVQGNIYENPELINKPQTRAYSEVRNE